MPCCASLPTLRLDYRIVATVSRLYAALLRHPNALGAVSFSDSVEVIRCTDRGRHDGRRSEHSLLLIRRGSYGMFADLTFGAANPITGGV